MENRPQTIQEKYNTFLSKLLKQKLFEPAMELNATLVKTFNVTAPYARKILERAVTQKAIKSSSPYTFGKGQYVYIYNEHDFDKDDVKRISEKSRPPIYRLLELMDQHKGIISYYEALKITAAPLEKSSTKVVSLDDILTLLMKLDIVHKVKDRNDLVYIVYKIHKDKEAVLELMMADHFTAMVADCSILPDVLRWLSNANIIDIGNAIYRNKKTPHIGAKHNNLVWDAFAYSRATGINPILGAKADTVDKKTLVVLDVVLTSEYSAIHLDAFMGRIQINRKSVNEVDRKILPIIIYRLCSTHTINKIRKNGIIAFDISAIFGTRIYEVLNSFKELSILLKENDGIEKTIENILKTINNAGQDEALKELRGTLFEFLMYPLLKTLYPNASIDRGKILTVENNGEKVSYEYDYIIESSNPPELIFVELKGYNASATINLGDTEKKATLRWFFRRTLPFAEKYYKTTIEKGKKAKAVFITSANFFDDGKEFIVRMNASKYRPKYLETGYDRLSLLELLKDYGFESEIRIINKFYSSLLDEDNIEMQDKNDVNRRNILSDIEEDLPF